MRKSPDSLRRILFVPLLGLFGCGAQTNSLPARDVRVRLECEIHPIGVLAKTAISSKIDLRQIDISVHRGVDTLLHESLPITSATRSISPHYTVPPGIWVVSARIRDATGRVIYWDSASIALAPADTAVETGSAVLRD